MQGNGEDPIKKEMQKGRERNYSREAGGRGIQSGAESGERVEAALRGG